MFQNFLILSNHFLLLKFLISYYIFYGKYRSIMSLPGILKLYLTPSIGVYQQLTVKLSDVALYVETKDKLYHALRKKIYYMCVHQMMLLYLQISKWNTLLLRQRNCTYRWKSVHIQYLQHELT